MNLFSWKRIFKIVIAVIIWFALAGGGYYLVRFRPVKIFLASAIGDNREHYLPCENLPFYVQVEKALSEHRGIVEKLKQAGAFNVSPHEVKCFMADGVGYFTKGDVEIDYNTHQQRENIEKLIGNNFFGIPWRRENH